MRLSTFITVSAPGSTIASSDFAHNNGTMLTSASGAASIHCIDSNSALVDILSKIKTSESVDAAAIPTSIDSNMVEYIRAFLEG